MFATITDHMSHFVKEHPEYHRNAPKKLFRKVTCWRCTAEMDRGDDERYRCSCGFVLPRKDESGVFIKEDVEKLKLL